MRIISKFNDFYDSASGYGVDTSVVYQRSTRVLSATSDAAQSSAADVELYHKIAAACDRAVHGDHFRNLGRATNHHLIFVGVAGKIYVGLRLLYDVEDAKQLPLPRLVYGREYGTIDVWNANNLSDEQLDKATANVRWAGATEVKSVREWFNLNDGKRVVESPVFADNSIVSFVATRQMSNYGYYGQQGNYNIAVDAPLTDVSFQRALDSFTTFQEISMFVTGVLPRAEQMTSVPTDKELLYARGHDDKSFKRAPTKRR